ncbi:2-oxoisovalerate dehydrogenase E1 component [Friedmanniella endophytica]|uniref:2-oxoisovalerate dehydrogenase E1 component n=1 Tax=Microlunatus kandeliicorticis TaxID=1759536 RepID=A0A7W3IQC2_9ACTN|nr:thiamine pyrophosphate-dependent enzyme [Microlunatus kandeliicorticis]MBA8793301.1 2-oxoisovalerate dehydrogenase E1 component [Microlunatus kandeliicorticis]
MNVPSGSGPAPGAALDRHLRSALAAARPGTADTDPTQPAPVPVPVPVLEAAFAAAASSRHLDVVARELQARGEGFYTIGSSGHESNALVALALRPTDPALLHYRSGGFYAARAGQVPGSTPVHDVLRGLTGKATEPIAGGRHKVFGHAALRVVPQTSTIASHLPRAVGLALSLRRATRLGLETPYPDDAVVVCSFGDASANHSTAAGAVNTALNAAYRRLPVPLLLVCEDNGWGISVPTPAGWIAQAYGSRPGLTYLTADGADPSAVWAAATAAVATARAGQPVFLHLRTVRFGAHAGSDAEIAYRTPRSVEADHARDPLLGLGRALVGQGLSADAVLARYDAARAAVDAAAAEIAPESGLASTSEVIAPLAPRRPAVVAARARELGGGSQSGPPRTLAESINATLADALAADPRTTVFGEDVGVKGGVYGVTGGLARRFGAARVFDSVLDEQSILGLALGAGLAGLRPVPEIQYLAYLHNAIDQLRGEAATLSFFSSGQYRNPLVVRVAGLAYQKGFGGHFHNDNALASLRDVPGLVVACPSRGDDAAAMLRTCLAAADVDGSVCVFLEPIALYHRRDLHEPGDGGWLAADDRTDAPVGVGRVHRAHGSAAEEQLTMITFGNGVPMSLRVARRLAEAGVGSRVLDLRWLSPLPVAQIVEQARATGRVLVVDETRHSGGVGEGVITALVEHGFTGPITRVSSIDSFVPLGRATEHVLLGEDEIEKAASELAGRGR